MAKWLRRLLLYPLLCVAGCHTLLTGSPIPLWYVEELEHPEPVMAVADSALILANGAHVELPFIRKLPTDHPVFDEAVQHGVDVHSNGEVVGLLRVQRICGNDPVVFRRVRVNLSDLAGVLNPSGIDPDVVPPDVIDLYEEVFSGITKSVRVDAHLFSKMNSIRNEFEIRTGEPNSTHEPLIRGRGGHDLRSGALVL